MESLVFRTRRFARRINRFFHPESSGDTGRTETPAPGGARARMARKNERAGRDEAEAFLCSEAPLCAEALRRSEERRPMRW